MILHAGELATELFDEVQSPRCTFAISIATSDSVVAASRAWYYNRWFDIVVSLKTKFKRHILEGYSWAFCPGKMTKLDFHHFQVRNFKNVFEQS